MANIPLMPIGGQLPTGSGAAAGGLLSAGQMARTASRVMEPEKPITPLQKAYPIPPSATEQALGLAANIAGDIAKVGLQIAEGRKKLHDYTQKSEAIVGFDRELEQARKRAQAENTENLDEYHSAFRDSGSALVDKWGSTIDDPITRQEVLFNLKSQLNRTSADVESEITHRKQIRFLSAYGDERTYRAQRVAAGQDTPEESLSAMMESSRAGVDGLLFNEEQKREEDEKSARIFRNAQDAYIVSKDPMSAIQLYDSGAQMKQYPTGDDRALLNRTFEENEHWNSQAHQAAALQTQGMYQQFMENNTKALANAAENGQRNEAIGDASDQLAKIYPHNKDIVEYRNREDALIKGHDKITGAYSKTSLLGRDGEDGILQSLHKLIIPDDTLLQDDSAKDYGNKIISQEVKRKLILYYSKDGKGDFFDDLAKINLKPDSRVPMGNGITPQQFDALPIEQKVAIKRKGLDSLGIEPEQQVLLSTNDARQFAQSINGTKSVADRAQRLNSLANAMGDSRFEANFPVLEKQGLNSINQILVATRDAPNNNGLYAAINMIETQNINPQSIEKLGVNLKDLKNEIWNEYSYWVGNDGFWRNPQTAKKYTDAIEQIALLSIVMDGKNVKDAAKAGTGMLLGNYTYSNVTLGLGDKTTTIQNWIDGKPIPKETFEQAAEALLIGRSEARGEYFHPVPSRELVAFDAGVPRGVAMTNKQYTEELALHGNFMVLDVASRGQDGRSYAPGAAYMLVDRWGHPATDVDGRRFVLPLDMRLLTEAGKRIGPSFGEVTQEITWSAKEAVGEAAEEAGKAGKFVGNIVSPPGPTYDILGKKVR